MAKVNILLAVKLLLMIFVTDLLRLSYTTKKLQQCHELSNRDDATPKFLEALTSHNQVRQVITTFLSLIIGLKWGMFEDSSMKSTGLVRKETYFCGPEHSSG